MSTMTCKLFGVPQILKDGQPVFLPYSKINALLYYILVSKVVSREELAGLLWPDETDETARRNLRNAIYQAKKALGTNIILSPKKSLLMLNENLDLTLDIDQFLQAPQENLHLYTGEFLQGFFLKGAETYEYWIVKMRNYQPASFPEDMTGVSFCGPEDQLAMEDRLSKVPLSFEATVKLPEALDGRGGVIIGSWMDAGYYDYDLGYVSLEVYENGAPRLYWHQERRNQPNGGVQSVVFSGVDLRQGEWIHLAVTFDPEKDTVSCYINGVLVSTVEDCEF